MRRKQNDKREGRILRYFTLFVVTVNVICNKFRLTICLRCFRFLHSEVNTEKYVATLEFLRNLQHVRSLRVKEKKANSEGTQQRFDQLFQNMNESRQND